jgi:hypothetical protein
LGDHDDDHDDDDDDDDDHDHDDHDDQTPTSAPEARKPFSNSTIERTLPYRV